MAFPMHNKYVLSDECYVDGIESSTDSLLVQAIGLFVPVTMETPIESDADFNKIKTPVIRFFPYNPELSEYYPYFIDVTNAPITINNNDTIIYSYTLCDADDIGHDETYYFKRPHFVYGAYIIFNPYDHSEYVFANAGEVASVTNEMLHMCEPWPVPDYGESVEGN